MYAKVVVNYIAKPVGKDKLSHLPKVSQKKFVGKDFVEKDEALKY
jgi:hypothetical protein